MLADLPAGETTREQPKYVDFARRETGRIFPSSYLFVARAGQHRLDRITVEPSGGYLRPQLTRRILGRSRRAMRSRLDHRLVDVGGGEDPGRSCDRRSFEPVRVAR